MALLSLLKKTKANGQLMTHTLEAHANAKECCSSNSLALNEQNQYKWCSIPEIKLWKPGLSSKENTKRLGVIIDSRLTWKLQPDQLCDKLSTAIFAIRRLKQNGSCTSGIRVLIQQKGAIRHQESCRIAFVQPGIPTVVILYIREVTSHPSRGHNP